jgi:hypothetical protein
MKPSTPDTPMLATTRQNDQQLAPEGDLGMLEQQMAERGLSTATKRFLRHLHRVEKQLNDAFEKAHQGSDLEQQVSQVYHDLYRAD